MKHESEKPGSTWHREGTPKDCFLACSHGVLIWFHCIARIWPLFSLPENPWGNVPISLYWGEKTQELSRLDFYEEPRWPSEWSLKCKRWLGYQEQTSNQGCRHCYWGDGCHCLSCFDILEEIFHTRVVKSSLFEAWSGRGEKKERWMDDKFRERSSRRRQRHRPVNLLYMSVWAPTQQGWSLKWAAGPCTSCGAVGVYNDFGIGGGDERGSYLYSESPVIFQYIWKNVKGEILQLKNALHHKKQMTQLRVSSISLIMSATLWLPHPLPLLAGDLFSTVTAKWNSHSLTVNSLFLILWLSPVDLLSDICGPINVHIPMFCPYFNPGVSVPSMGWPWCKGDITKLRCPSTHWNWQPPKHGLPL